MTSRSVSSHIPEAIKLEEKAQTLRRDSHVSADEIGETYEMAGNLRLAAKDYITAEEDYIYAKRFGYAHNPGKIAELDRKIEQVKKSKNLTSTLKSQVGNPFLKKYPFAILSIASLLIALSFVSLSLTGNVIAGLEQNNSRWIGLCFFVCGLIFSFLYLRKKR
jgi:hypothetical protein